MMNRNRLIAGILFFAAMLSMVGCASKVRDFDRKDRDQKDTDTWRPGMSSSVEAVLPTQAIREETPTAAAPSEVPVQQEPQPVCEMHDIDYSSFEGTTYETLAGKITFYDDNSFVMVANLFEGWGTLTGSYRFESPGTFYCTVSGKNFSGFTGDSLQAFSLSVMSEGAYVIALDGADFLGMVDDGDHFQVVEQ